jgi:putative ABC transport system permease protein
MRSSPGRIGLAVLAIALGVALGLAVHLINRSAADEISAAARSLYGLADLSVQGGSEGLDERFYPLIARTQGVQAVSPIVEVQARYADRRGAIDLIGADPFRVNRFQPALASLANVAAEGPGVLERDVVYVSAAAARELGLQRGDALRIQIGLDVAAFKVGGVLPAAAFRERAGVIDIADAQQRFGKLGKLSRVDVRIEPGAGVERVRERLRALLPASASVATPGGAADDALRLSRAYRSNLTALALVALFTGGFFVYSTQALFVLRRRREFAVLHALGVTRAQQLGSVLAGSVLMGALGALLGCAIGVAAARFGLARLGGDLGAGYFSASASAFEVRAAELVVFAALGVAAAITGAVRPALEAARIPTANALKAGDVASAQARAHPVFILVTALLAGAALLAPPIADLPLPGYAAIALLLIATVAATPVMVRIIATRALRVFTPAHSVARLTRPSGAEETKRSSWLRRSRRSPAQFLILEIALAQIAGAARYATLSVAAIIVSFSLMTSMAIMVTSFRDSLDAWIQKLLPADIYVRVGYVGQSAYLEPETADSLRRLPGVARAEYSRFAQAQIPGESRPITVIARTLDEQGAGETLWIVHEARNSPPASATPIWINEAAADLYRWGSGEVRRISIGGREIDTFVRGVWRDYEHQNGALVMGRDAYVGSTGDRAVNTVWLWAQDDAPLDRLRAEIRDLLPTDAQYDLRTPQELRRSSLAVFDRTFAVTYLLEVIAVLIGLFGIAAGMSAQVLARRGEFGALRHLGFTRAQVGAMLAVEGATLGALGVLVGLAAGALVSLILIYVVNRQSFHWSMDLSAPGMLLTLLSAGLVAMSALIAVLAGRRAMSGDVVAAVKEDW